MAGSNPVAFGANATSINFGNSMKTNPRPAGREYAREDRASVSTQVAPLPDWDRFWSDLPIAPTHDDRGASSS